MVGKVRWFLGPVVSLVLLVCLSACIVPDQINNQPTGEPTIQPAHRRSQYAFRNLQEAVYYYAGSHAVAPDDFLGFIRLAKACTALEEAGAEDAVCREAAERIVGG
jgi:hypothetical protein